MRESDGCAGSVIYASEADMNAPLPVAVAQEAQPPKLAAEDAALVRYARRLFKDAGEPTLVNFTGVYLEPHRWRRLVHLLDELLKETT
jgi:hypothetical protein